MHAFHEMPGGHAVTQQHQNHHEQQRHHDAQAALKPGDHALGDDEGRQQHENRMPKCQTPWIGDDIAEISADLIGCGALEVAAAHIDNVVERPAADHTIERQDQQCRDHPGKCAPRPFARVPGFQCQHLQGVRRTLPGAPADQGFSEHDRDADQRDARQKHQHKGAAAVDPDHVGELPDTTQSHGRTGRGEYEYPAASPTAVDRNLVCRHRLSRPSVRKRGRIVRDSLNLLKHAASP
ncbi:hypothetical protein D3C85_687090 [compost metagenome]